MPHHKTPLRNSGVSGRRVTTAPTTNDCCCCCCCHFYTVCLRHCRCNSHYCHSWWYCYCSWWCCYPIRGSPLQGSQFRPRVLPLLQLRSVLHAAPLGHHVNPPHHEDGPRLRCLTLHPLGYFSNLLPDSSSLLLSYGSVVVNSAGAGGYIVSSSTLLSAVDVAAVGAFSPINRSTYSLSSKMRMSAAPWPSAPSMLLGFGSPAPSCGVNSSSLSKTRMPLSTGRSRPTLNFRWPAVQAMEAPHHESTNNEQQLE